MKQLKYFIALFAFINMACVSATKYKQLESENNTCQDHLKLSEARVNELEAKLGIASSEKSRLSASVEEMRLALSESEKRKQETEKRLAEFKELMSKFKKLVDAGKLKIKFLNGKMVLALSTDILFSSGSADLSAQGKTSLKEVTSLLSELEDKKFQIEGHTDNVPIVAKKQYDSNWVLASDRAMSVLKTMLDAGMPAERISIASYGETQPIASNKTTEGKASNRRIAIVVVPDLSGLPGFDELNRVSSSH